MRKTLTILLILTFGLFSCKSEKKYSDYNKTDFYEVQGIINYVNPINDLFDSTTKKNVSFTYFLDRPNPKNGIENNLKMFEAKNGYPLIVLVHKDDENISFYGRIGILDKLNKKEKEFLSEHIKSEIGKLKTKIPEHVYNTIIKENKTDQIKKDNLNRLIIGKWNFIRATDSSGIKYTYIKGGHGYKIVTSNIQFKLDMTYTKYYGKNKFTICYWNIKNDSIFQFGGQLDSLSYNKKFEDFTQVIREINKSNLILELKPNLYFHYEKKDSRQVE